MRKPFLAFIAMVNVIAATAQENQVKYPYKKKQAVGFQFTLHDFQTAIDLKNTSISRVLQEKQWHSLSSMSSGLAITYMKGLTDNFDFSARLGISSVAYPIPGKSTSQGGVLWESDVNLHYKFFTDRYWVAPFLTAGAGASKWTGYYGAYIPLGVGLQLNVNDEGYVLLNADYRVAVTTATTASHFFYSLGVAIPIPDKK